LAHPDTAVCLTVTDDQGRMIQHACGKPVRKNTRETNVLPSGARYGPPRKPGPPDWVRNSGPHDWDSAGGDSGSAPKPSDFIPPDAPNPRGATSGGGTSGGGTSGGGTSGGGTSGGGTSDGGDTCGGDIGKTASSPFDLVRLDDPGPPGSAGVWLLIGGPEVPDLKFTIWPATTDPCDHRLESSGHDPGAELRHLTQIRYATCTGPTCRRPATQAEYEHNTPHDIDGKTCLCNGNPKCKHDHRLKQHPRWTVEQRPDGLIVWTAPTGRQATTEPTRYPI
jgi:hypothetical protein